MSMLRRRLMMMQQGGAAVTQPNNEVWYTTTDGAALGYTAGQSLWWNTVLSDTYVNGKGVLAFASDIKYLPGNTLASSTKLLTVSFPASLDISGSGFLCKQASLTELTLHSTSSKLPWESIKNNSALTKITFDGICTKLDQAITYCPMLTEVSFGNLASIDSASFRSCNANLVVTIYGTTVPDISGWSQYMQPTFRIPAAAYDAWMADEYWAKYTGKIEIF